MHQPHSESSPNIMHHTMNSNQMIRFPTITKLMYDGDNSQIKNSFKSTNTKLISKTNLNSLPVSINTLAQTNAFRLVEVPPDDHVMRICMMSINDPGTKYRSQPEQIESMTSRNALGFLRKDRSSSILARVNNPLNRRASLISINCTVENPVN